MTGRHRRFLGVIVITAGCLYLLWLHAQLMRALPDPIFQPDSEGYIRPALECLTGKGFHVSAYRTFGYPLWLLFWLTLTRSFHGLLMAQHFVALVTALAAGVLAHQFFLVSKWNALTITFLVATLPRLLIYSHTVLTDVVYASVLILNVLLLLSALRNPTIQRWVYVAIGAWVGLLFRPVGFSFVAAAGLLMVFKLITETHRRSYIVGALVFLSLYFSTCAVNLKARGFWGLDQFGGISLFGSTARYTSPELSAATPNWVRYDPAGPVAMLKARYPEPGALNRLLLHLSYVGIRQHPLHFIKDQVVLFLNFFWTASARPEFLYSKESTMAHGLVLYAGLVRPIPEAAAFISFHPSTAAAYFSRMALSHVYPYEPTLFTYWLWPWVFLIRWAGLAAIFLTPCLWRKKERRGATLAVWLVIIAHIGVSNLGGDTDGRHALPVEPLFVLLALSGLEKAMEGLKRHGGRLTDNSR